MSLVFSRETYQPIIMVMGVGGAGCNAVANMFRQGIHGVEFVVCNTDSQVLGINPVPRRLLIGQKLTGGLGCGADPERGRQAAQESIEEIRELFQPPLRMVFLTAGLGGGTGTGGLPIIAEVCQDLGLLTVAVVTLPFNFEGEPRKRNALRGLAELEAHVDALVVVHNNNILRIASPNMRQKEAFLMADQVLYRGVRGIAEVVTKPGYVNVDFADVKTIMEKGGYALLGMSTQRGENRALMAVEEALSSPLLDDVDIRGARGLLVNITASSDTLTIQETEQIMNRITEALGVSETNIIVGQVFDEEAEDELSLTLIATGLERPQSIKGLNSSPASQKRPSSVPSSPPIEMELALGASSALPSEQEAPSIPLEERLRELEKDPRAIEKA
ncbi:MAG: cell division protein FtsZ, partial [Bacteroidia bacterium]|nr:cell division protein FtsZ [Bacteroidia bacterium]MDW8135063.1 cell division protein FtsZ [Bacteroidia bacterium]